MAKLCQLKHSDTNTKSSQKYHLMVQLQNKYRFYCISSLNSIEEKAQQETEKREGIQPD